MTPDPARRLAVLREVAAADPDGDIAFLLDIIHSERRALLRRTTVEVDADGVPFIRVHP